MKKKIVVVMLALSFSILGGCGSEYQEAYKEMQAEAEKQAAEMQAEAEKQAAEMQKEIEKQTEAIIKGSAEQEQDQEQTGETETEPAETDQTEVVEVQEETEEYPDEVDGITVLFYEKVHNDVTGNWRLAVIYDGSDLNSYVGDFYKAYVKDDSEVPIPKG